MNILDTKSNSLGVNPNSLDALMIRRYQCIVEKYIKTKYPNKSYAVKNIKIVRPGNYVLVNSPEIEFLNKFDTISKDLGSIIIENERYTNSSNEELVETLAFKTTATNTTTTTLVSGYEFSINGSTEVKGNVTFGLKFLAEAKAEAKVNVGGTWKHNSSSTKTITDTTTTERSRQQVIKIPAHSSRILTVTKTETQSVKKAILDIHLKEMEFTEENYYHLTAEIVSNKSSRIVETLSDFLSLNTLAQPFGACYVPPRNITEFEGGISLKQEIEFSYETAKFTTVLEEPTSLGEYECDEYESEIDNEYYMFFNEIDTVFKIEQEYLNEVPLDNYIIVEIPGPNIESESILE
ncbi:TPA: ETX/MTX2 family pore-forming toxin [Bacillus cereus]|nr:ETX/MTX2 family pore-forming toxin [Bacillus cereus]MDA1769663.1 ETX/MTX2 family pore-forming toxin [Bacillus cereus]